MNYRYIVIEGCIGSKKTELADKLSFFFNCIFIKENPGKNPFLIPFFLNIKHHALAAQLQFLLDRSRILEQIKNEELKNDATIISDFLIEKDKIFAPVTLESDELDLYWKIRNQIMPNIIKPDLIILLEPSLDKIYTNLDAKKGSSSEIYPPNFIKKIFDEYQRFFYVYDEVPILIANTDELDFINNDDHFNLLIKTMSNLQGKKNYINLNE
ncbi:deoxynucleoside kinase [Neisseriaceae bacterium PsAf]|nr:deoxynucleoside kinase [Neisseriaceae bacterium PsAf]MCV2502543.1 deoxynucleoside kinase [Neisseriaceae bacterium]